MKHKKHFLNIAFICFSAMFIYGQTLDSKFKFVKELGGVEEYVYEPNGLSVLLIQDNTAPVVTTQITYRVGSKHEVSGNTGSTHLLEHMLFKGTPKYNKETITISSALQNIGARMNATTWYDRTNYYETIPSDYLELALDIEADRMRNSLLKSEDKAAEMTVVRNEFERGENNPNRLLSKEIWSTAYMAHTYHHSTIGWRSDIENAPIEKLREFYNTYYWPNNATLSIIGDFNKANAFELIDTSFGVITKAPHEFPQPYTEEPEQYGPRKIVIKKPGQQGVVVVAFKSPGKLHKDHAALTALSDILKSGASSILNITFTDTGLALYAYSSISGFKDHNLFSVGVGLTPNTTHQKINDKIVTVINTIMENGVTQEDLDRVVAKAEANDVLRRDGSFAIAGIINEAIAAGDWTNYINNVENLKKVTLDDVKRVANTYLLEDQSTTGYFIPKNSGSNKKIPINKTNQFKNDDGKVFFRNPKTQDYYNDFISDYNQDASLEQPSLINSKLDYKRQIVSGIDITTVKTGAKGFVNIIGSINAGSINTIKNRNIASITADMLLKGSTSKDKYALSKALESLGVKMNIRANTYKTTFSFKCLSNNVEEVVALLADALRNPAFDEKEFELLVKQYSGRIKNNLDNPSILANIKLSQLIYPIGHPEYLDSVEVQIKKINEVTLDDIKAFHKDYYGSNEMHVVAVGDINEKTPVAFSKTFKDWNGGVSFKSIPLRGKPLAKAQTEIITVKGKPSAQLLIAQYTGLTSEDADFRSMQLATFALGGGMSGRLMQTVRDVDGLTYSISARHSSDTYTDGHFVVKASFNPTLLKKGEDATMLQIKKWIDGGISTNELANKKANLIGSYKVRLSTTGSMAGTILSFINQGKQPSYIDQYPKDINALTLSQVNEVIKKYINPKKFITLKSGSIDEKGNPLKK